MLAKFKNILFLHSKLALMQVDRIIYHENERCPPTQFYTLWRDMSILEYSN